MRHLGLTIQSPQYGVLIRSWTQTEGVGVRDAPSVLIRKKAAAMGSHIAYGEPAIRKDLFAAYSFTAIASFS